MIDFKQFVEIFTREFGPPFLESGFVFTGVNIDENGNKSLHLRIGPKEIEINEQGKVIKSGSILEDSLYDRDVFGSFLDSESSLEVEATNLYSEALEEHPEFWSEATTLYPDYNHEQAQEATNYILDRFEVAYKEFYPNDQIWMLVKQYLDSKIFAGLT